MLHFLREREREGERERRKKERERECVFSHEFLKDKVIYTTIIQPFGENSDSTKQANICGYKTGLLWLCKR